MNGVSDSSRGGRSKEKVCGHQSESKSRRDSSVFVARGKESGTTRARLRESSARAKKVLISLLLEISPLAAFNF